MDEWIEFAKGPLFAITFLVMVLGLGRQVVLQLYFLSVKKGRRLRGVAWNKIARETLSWAIPVRHMEPGNGVFSASSYVLAANADDREKQEWCDRVLDISRGHGRFVMKILGRHLLHKSDVGGVRLMDVNESTTPEKLLQAANAMVQRHGFQFLSKFLFGL